MKKIIQLVAMLCITTATVSTSSAQDSTKQLFHIPSVTSIGVYIAPEFQYGQMKGGFTEFGGGSVMLLFNKTFGIGLSGMRSMNAYYQPSSVAPLYAHAAFGGLKMEYTLKPNSMIHFNINLLSGFGRVGLDSSAHAWHKDARMSRHHNSFPMNEADTHRGEASDYVMLQPGLQVEVNLFRFVKLFAGANYRFAIPAYHTSSQISASSMQGFSGNVGLKFGLFDYPIKKKEKAE